MLINNYYIMSIGDYSIGGYWCLLMIIILCLLVTIILVDIGAY